MNLYACPTPFQADIASGFYILIGRMLVGVLSNGVDAFGSPYLIPGSLLTGDLGETLTADNPSTPLAYA